MLQSKYILIKQVIVTSLAMEAMFFVALVCLFVCLFVDNITKNSYEWIGMKFYGGVLGSTMKKLIKFWWQSGYSKMSK